MMDSEPAITAASQTVSLCLMKNAASGWQKYYRNMPLETRKNSIKNTSYEFSLLQRKKNRHPLSGVGDFHRT